MQFVIVISWIDWNQEQYPDFWGFEQYSYSFSLCLFFFVSLNRKRSKKHVERTVRRERITASFRMHSIWCDCIEFIELKSFPEKWSKVNKMCIADSEIRFVTYLFHGNKVRPERRNLYTMECSSFSTPLSVLLRLFIFYCVL